MQASCHYEHEDTKTDNHAPGDEAARLRTAAQQGISFAEYVRRLIAEELGPPKPKRKPDISIIFDLIKDGPRTTIARDKDKLIGEAVWDNDLRKMERKPRRRHSPL